MRLKPYARAQRKKNYEREMKTSLPAIEHWEMRRRKMKPALRCVRALHVSYNQNNIIIAVEAI